MSHYDHVQVMKNLEAIARNAALGQLLVSDDELSKTWETLERCDSLGAVLLPTEYRNALQSGTLERQRDLVAFVRSLRKGLRDLFPDDPILAEILTPKAAASSARVSEEPDGVSDTSPSGARADEEAWR